MKMGPIPRPGPAGDIVRRLAAAARAASSGRAPAPSEGPGDRVEQHDRPLLAHADRDRVGGQHGIRETMMRHDDGPLAGGAGEVRRHGSEPEHRPQDERSRAVGRRVAATGSSRACSTGADRLSFQCVTGFLSSRSAPRSAMSIRLPATCFHRFSAIRSSKCL